MNATVKNALKTANDYINKGRSNSYLTAALTVFVILYGALAAPKLPSFIANLFNNAIFRLLCLFTIAWIASKNAQVAIIVAVVFTLIMSLLNTQQMAEGFIAGMTSDRQQNHQ
jgi:hypothetical protein